MVSVLEGPRGTAWAAALDEERKVRRSPCSRHPSGHCFLAPRVLVRAWGAVGPSPPSGGSGSLRSERDALFLYCPDFSQCAGACMHCLLNPVGPGLGGPPGAACRSVDAPGDAWVSSVAAVLPAPPLPRLHPSLTLACPSRPESNSPCSATLSGVSPAPGDVSEPTCHFLQ